MNASICFKNIFKNNKNILVIIKKNIKNKTTFGDITIVKNL